ncbi:MAG: cadherin-like domain-containing protein [Bdellovibrionales bacterium]|nr:cadherin-like domain-containing protein [Bdellovibrionales bacterium]
MEKSRFGQLVKCVQAISVGFAVVSAGCSDGGGGGSSRSALGTSGGSTEPTVPAAVDDNYVATEDAILSRSAVQGLMDNDDQPSGFTLTAAVVTPPSSGDLTLNADGSFDYDPDADFFGVDSFTYELNDGTTTYGPATVTLSVGAVNDSPTLSAIGDPAAIDEDSGSISGIAYTLGEGGGALEDSQSITVTATSSNTTLVPNGNITVNYTPEGAADADLAGGTLDVTPASHQNGTTTITVTATDDGTGNLTAQRSFTATVNALNDAPTIADIANQTTDEDTDLSGLAFTVDEGGAPDEDAQALTVTAVSSNQGLIPDANITVNYTPDAAADATGGTLDLELVANASGTATITVTVQDDGTGAPTAQDTFTVTVTAVNDIPVLTAPSSTLDYMAGNSAMPIEPAGTVSDIDSADFDAGELRAEITAAGSADDRLTILNEGSGAGQIGVSGATISYGGTTIGTASGGTSGSSPLVVALNSSATPAAVQGLLRRVAFSNVAADPDNTNRTVSFTAQDGDGGTSAAVTKTVRVWDAPSDIIGFYEFEDAPNTSTTADSSGLGNTGTLNGFTLANWITPGFIGQSLNFVAASSAYIQTTASVASEDEFTISVWVKPTAATLTAAQHVVWQGDTTANGWGSGTTFNAGNHEMHLSLNYFNACFTGVNFYYGGTDAVDGACADRVDNVVVNSAAALSSTVWNHIAVTVSGANGATVTASLYVNGTLSGTDSGTEVDRSQWDSDLRIARPGAASRFYNGEVDHIRLYNRALTGGEISTLALEGRP